jgi:hypothetical protein
MSKVMVTIHGAGKQPSTFYQEGVAALTARLGYEPACMPVWWADLLNVGPAVKTLEFDESGQLVADPKVAERAALRQALAREMGIPESEVAEREITPSDVEEKGLLDLPIAAIDVVNDVVEYVLNPAGQAPMRQQLIDSLEQVCGQYDQVILVSHSLGTVISFDVLHDHADRYPVSIWFTLGCPLAKLVRLRQRTSDLGKISPATVAKWWNMYDTNDPVADPIAPAFPAYQVYDDYVRNAPYPFYSIQAHDYWRNPQVLDILASVLR